MAKQSKKHDTAAVLEKLRAHLEENGPHKGTAPSLAKAIGVPVEVMGRAAQSTRRGDFFKEHGWRIPPTGRGKDTTWKVERKRSRSGGASGSGRKKAEATAGDAHSGSLAA